MRNFLRANYAEFAIGLFTLYLSFAYSLAMVHQATATRSHILFIIIAGIYIFFAKGAYQDLKQGIAPNSATLYTLLTIFLVVITKGIFGNAYLLLILVALAPLYIRLQALWPYDRKTILNIIYVEGLRIIMFANIAVLGLLLLLKLMS